MKTSTALNVLREMTDRACRPLEWDANMYELGHHYDAAVSAYKRRKKYREAYAEVYYKVGISDGN